MTQIYILDGGLGTSLEQHYNVHFSKAQPLWSADLLVTDPETLQRCQLDFGSIPVDILLTATYQISFDGFNKTVTKEFPNGIPDSAVPQYIERAIDIGHRAKGTKAQLALSVGPYGACMNPSQEYSGVYDAHHNSEDSLLQWHAERLAAFAAIPDVSSRVDYVALETIPRQDEIVAMRKALGNSSELSKVPFWISCLYPGDDNQLPDGTPAEEAVRHMVNPAFGPTPWGVGINCTKIWKLKALISKYELQISSMIESKELAQWPALVLYPDGTNGEVYNTTTKQWEKPSATEVEQRVSWEQQLSDVLIEVKSRNLWKSIVVGGCCMADFQAISKLKGLVMA